MGLIYEMTAGFWVGAAIGVMFTSIAGAAALMTLAGSTAMRRFWYEARHTPSER